METAKPHFGHGLAALVTGAAAFAVSILPVAKFLSARKFL
jgi:hypothetical protein